MEAQMLLKDLKGVARVAEVPPHIIQFPHPTSLQYLSYSDMQQTQY